MNCAIVTVPVVDLHKYPDAPPHFVDGYDKRCGTQVVKGDCVHLVEEKGLWSKIEIPLQRVCHNDGHVGPWQGWVPSNAIHLSSACFCPKLKREPPQSVDLLRDKIVSIAKRYIGCPFVYGGLSERGVNCSGLVYRAYASVGIILPRKASTQYQESEPVQILQKGDLIFFVSPVGRVSHVAIWDGEEVIESMKRGGVVRSLPFEERFGMTRDQIYNGYFLSKEQRQIYFRSIFQRRA